MLTDTKIRSLKPAEKTYRVADAGGLYIEVSPKGGKVWRQTYRFAGKPRTHTHGPFPETKLAQARLLREKLKAQVRAGEDPRPAPAAPAEPGPAARPGDGRTWRRYAQRYVEKREREGAAQRTLDKLVRWADQTAEVMGDLPVDEIGAKQVIAACRPFEEAGKLNTAHGVRSFCSQVFRFAIAHGDANLDPAAAARDAIARPADRQYPGVTEPARVGEIMRTIRSHDLDPVVRAGLLLLAYLFVRNGEVRQMRWDQLDGDRWVVPPEAMKMKREHIVPLPRQAREIIDGLWPITGRDSHVLQSRTRDSGVLSENTLGGALVRLGIPKSEHVPHGFRTTASTTLYEHGWNGDWIERQLAHVERNKVKGAYNRAEYLDRRAEMMQWYADWLDAQAARQW